jgi:hypothetical protein
MWMWVLWSLQRLPESIRELAQSQGGQAVSDTPRTDALTFDVITILFNAIALGIVDPVTGKVKDSQ